MLITDHNVRETLRITDRAYIVNDGCDLPSGTPESPRGGRRRSVECIWAPISDWTDTHERLDVATETMAIQQKLHTKLARS